MKKYTSLLCAFAPMPLASLRGADAPPSRPNIDQERLALNSALTPDGAVKPDAAPAQLHRLNDDPRQSVNLYRENPVAVRALDETLKRTIRDRCSNIPIGAFLPPDAIQKESE